VVDAAATDGTGSGDLSTDDAARTAELPDLANVEFPRLQDVVDVPDAPAAPEAGEAAAEDVPAETAEVVISPTCLNPVLPDSCMKEALTCTGLPTCGPTVTSCFQYGTDLSMQATWLVNAPLVSLSFGDPTFTASTDAMSVEFSNGARMLSEFLPRPRAIYWSPQGDVCATLDFHYEENSGNWGDYDVARHYYLRYGENQVIVIRPRFSLSPGAWWRIDGFEVRCQDGNVEEYTFDEFKPFAYLLFGGESHEGESRLPYWTADGCRLGEFKKECVHQVDIEKQEWCDGAALHVCKRGVSLTLDCTTFQKGCAQVPVGYGGEVYWYHSFCWGQDPCPEDFCDGDRLGACWGGATEFKDCAQVGGTCALQPGYPPYTQAAGLCVSKPAKQCNQANTSHCEGKIVVTCAPAGYEVRYDCTKSGLSCAQGAAGDGTTWAVCLPNESVPCDAEVVAGCEGDIKSSCIAGKLVELDCKAQYGKTCKEGTTGSACVDPDSTPCENSDANCVGCDGDRRVACGAGGLTVFDDCSSQGLDVTGGEGRTCYSGAGPDLNSKCPYCGQKNAGTCQVGAFPETCAGEKIVKCFGDHQIELACSETLWMAGYPDAWCNINQWGQAYCEPISNPPCDPATTPSKCQGQVAVNCTNSEVLESVDCAEAGLQCKLNQTAAAICIQPGANQCDPTSFVSTCDGNAIVSCNQGYTFLYPCSGGLECGINGDGEPICHQNGAQICDWWLFDYKCDGTMAISCTDGFVNQTDCATACPNCTCKSSDMQAWCEPAMP